MFDRVLNTLLKIQVKTETLTFKRGHSLINSSTVRVNPVRNFTRFVFIQKIYGNDIST